MKSSELLALLKREFENYDKGCLRQMQVYNRHVSLDFWLPPEPERRPTDFICSCGKVYREIVK